MITMIMNTKRAIHAVVVVVTMMKRAAVAAVAAVVVVMQFRHLMEKMLEKHAKPTIEEHLMMELSLIHHMTEANRLNLSVVPE